jgi:phosphoenolpyruvate synthase/pyruvate phosphate dikinase
MIVLRRLDDVGLADAPDVGAKAASLGALLADGVRVPAGVILPVGVEIASPVIRRSAIADVVNELGVGRFAVRSSGVTEDGAERSFAGIYESILDVASEDLGAAVDRSLASAGAARVTDYAANDAAAMAVLIQRMIEPIAAGVALTADPISGDRRACVVTAVRGLGERPKPSPRKPGGLPPRGVCRRTWNGRSTRTGCCGSSRRAR